jgi:hypothetical protein
MAKNELPSPELLRKLIDYDPASGVMIWRARSPELFTDSIKSAAHVAAYWNSRFAGTPALASIGRNGYLHGRIFGDAYLAHRVAWAIHYGEWPLGQIDHINHDRTNNRIANLRVVRNSENCKNTTLRASNTSGITGVTWDRANNRWRAQICVNGVMISLGRFTNKSDAIRVRKQAERRHGFHENHGRHMEANYGQAQA